jgi:hypothetical protein
VYEIGCIDGTEGDVDMYVISWAGAVAGSVLGDDICVGGWDLRIGGAMRLGGWEGCEV